GWTGDLFFFASRGRHTRVSRDWSSDVCSSDVEETRSFICSRRLSASEALATARAHWGIENELHWVLDVTFREDDCRVRAGNAAENFAVIRHFALNLLKGAKSTASVRGRRKIAGWDNRFLLQVLMGGGN